MNKKLKENILINWKVYLVKLVFCLLGLYLFTLGIALYNPTKVGATHMDFAIFAIVGNIWGIEQSGELSSEVMTKHYMLVMTLYLVVLSIISNIFLIINIFNEYKIKKNKAIFWKILINISMDAILMVSLGKMIEFHWMYVHPEKIQSIPSMEVRSWVFIGSYLIYVVGVACWVYSGYILGPYNGIADNFINLTKMKFGLARALLDILITLPGIITLLISYNSSWEVRGNFLVTYLNFGSLCFILLTGPIVNAILNKFKKWFELDKLKNTIMIIDNKFVKVCKNKEVKENKTEHKTK